MTGWLALITAAVLVLIALIHVYWALGGRSALGAAVPEIEGRAAFRPGRLATLAVAAALLVAALLIATTGQLIKSPLPPAVARLLSYCLGAVFIARAIGDFRLVGFFKRVRGSAFARLDSAVYAPLCLALGVAALLVGYGVG